MIILQCIKEKSKLRIKFHSYIDVDGKRYENVYNNHYNCQFPKDIREDGRYFSIGDYDLHLIYDGTKAPFYKVNKRNIKILSDEELKKYLDIEIPKLDLSKLKIFDAPECVICLSEPSKKIFIPCGHRCCCENCYKILSTKSTKKKECPLCRREITNCVEEEG